MSKARDALPLKGPIAAPSILSADFTRFAAEIAIVNPHLDWVHCDIMDRRFVPNLSFGPLVVQAVRKLTSAFIDVHLMVEQPERMLKDFKEAGADQMTVHVEACPNPGSVLHQVRLTGTRVGLALKPGTPLAAADPYLDGLDLLLIMTVEPGFGGQEFMGEVLPKVEAARDRRQRTGARFLIEVDGGIAPDTAVRCLDAGADVFVAGHAIYGAPRPEAALNALREVLAG
jgi:ribulose-phosphate 3-epimerase